MRFRGALWIIAALAMSTSPLALAGTAAVTIDYPAEGTLFPPDIEAPTFLWHDADPRADRWRVTIDPAGEAEPIEVEVPGDPPPRGEIDPRCISVTNRLYEPTPYQASARSWKPSPEIWDALKRGSVAAPARVAFVGYAAADPSVPLSRGTLTLRTSKDPVGAPIFYRDVPLMPSATREGVVKPLDQKAQPLIAWRLRDIARSESRVLLQDMPSCANCHSFTADGGTLAMDIDGPQGDKGAYGIVPIRPETVIRDRDVMTWNAFPDKPRGLNTLGFMSRISPDGRWVVSTVNEALYVRNFWDHRFSQVFYPTRGILAAYDRSSGEIRALPGADDPAFVHCNPVWTPDGKTLIFARGAARDPYERGRPLATYAGDPNETPMRYDLYRIPFNDGRGGRAEPVAGAADNGMSNAFPKVSPDGKWIVFTQSANGLLMRPDSKLWIVPVAGGAARPLESNLPLMNSWHSFSPNGRWLVFSSKSNTPYTQMFLTHLDEQGHATPAVLIENSTAANRAVNIPEFVDVAYDEFRSISVPAVDHYIQFQRGNDLAREGRYDEAIAEFRRALEGEHTEWRTTDWRIHDSLSKILLRLGQHERALEHARQSLEIYPYNAEMQTNVGYLLIEAGRPGEALEHLDHAVRLRPDDALPWYNRAALRAQLGDRAGAIQDYSEAIERNPRHAEAYGGRGIQLAEAGDPAGGLEDLDRAVELNPSNPTSRYYRARVRAGLGDAAGALDDLREALAVAPPGWSHEADVASLREKILAAREGS